MNKKILASVSSLICLSIGICQISNAMDPMLGMCGRDVARSGAALKAAAQKKLAAQAVAGSKVSISSNLGQTISVAASPKAPE